MNFAKIRFEINPQGHYLDACVEMQGNTILESATYATILCAGYQLAQGNKAFVLAISDVPQNGDPYKIGPELIAYIERIKNHGT